MSSKLNSAASGSYLQFFGFISFIPITHGLSTDILALSRSSLFVSTSAFVMKTFMPLFSLPVVLCLHAASPTASILVVVTSADSVIIDDEDDFVSVSLLVVVFVVCLFMFGLVLSVVLLVVGATVSPHPACLHVLSLGRIVSLGCWGLKGQALQSFHF
jgi:hypothetical protein